MTCASTTAASTRHSCRADAPRRALTRQSRHWSLPDSMRPGVNFAILREHTRTLVRRCQEGSYGDISSCDDCSDDASKVRADASGDRRSRAGDCGGHCGRRDLTRISELWDLSLDGEDAAGSPPASPGSNYDHRVSDEPAVRRSRFRPPGCPSSGTSTAFERRREVIRHEDDLDLHVVVRDAEGGR